jgi:hypothetical protein
MELKIDEITVPFTVPDDALAIEAGSIQEYELVINKYLDGAIRHLESLKADIYQVIDAGYNNISGMGYTQEFHKNLSPLSSSFVGNAAGVQDLTGTEKPSDFLAQAYTAMRYDKNTGDQGKGYAVENRNQIYIAAGTSFLNYCDNDLKVALVDNLKINDAPDNEKIDESKVKSGVIYIDKSGQYFVRGLDGKVYQGPLPDDIKSLATLNSQNLKEVDLAWEKAVNDFVAQKLPRLSAEQLFLADAARTITAINTLSSQINKVKFNLSEKYYEMVGGQIPTIPTITAVLEKRVENSHVLKLAPQRSRIHQVLAKLYDGAFKILDTLSLGALSSVRCSHLKQQYQADLSLFKPKESQHNITNASQEEEKRTSLGN